MWEVAYKVKKNISLFLKDLCLQKHDFYRDLNPLDRIYNVFHTTLFCYGAQNGLSIFFLTLNAVDKQGAYFVVFLIIYGLITLFSGICYAEMAALMPSTGAAYHYCYYSMGEFIAFLAGWNLIYGQVLHCYFRCSHIRYFLDEVLFGNWIENNLNVIPKFSFYDFLHFGGTLDLVFPIIILTVAALSTAFVKKGKYVCSIFALMLITALIFYLLIFSFHFNLDNLFKKTRESNSFASSCFVNAAYILCGYEVISILGEETIDPTVTIPKSILISVMWTIFIIVCWASAIALVWPGLIVDASWPMRAIMETLNMGHLRWISFVGYLAGAWCSTYASFFLLIRLVYAMSRDGLLFNIFSKIDRHTTAPFIPALILALILSLLGLIIRIHGGLFYSSFYSLMGTKIIIYACLLHTRYEYKRSNSYYDVEDRGDRWILINWPRRQTRPTPLTHRLCVKLIFIIVMASYLLIQSLMTMKIHNLCYWWMKTIGVFALAVLLLAFALLSQQPQNDRSYLQYYAPDVPFIPVIAMLCDFVVCMNDVMNPQLWLPLVVWWLLGIIFYFAFSRKNSLERRMLNPDGTKWEIMYTGEEDFGTIFSRDEVSLMSPKHSDNLSGDEKRISNEYVGEDNLISLNEQQPQELSESKSHISENFNRTTLEELEQISEPASSIEELRNQAPKSENDENTGR